MEGYQESIRIVDAEDIDRILNRIHDRSFQLEEMTFDKQNGTLIIPTSVLGEYRNKETKLFGLIKYYKRPDLYSEIKIRTVDSFTLIDNAEVGEGIFNTIEFTKEKLIIIKSSVPVQIKISVTLFDVELVIQHRGNRE